MASELTDEDVALALGWETHLHIEASGMVSGCVLSECGTWRVALWRVWEPSLPIWGMGLLNPSKATHLETDPTITRQVVRAQRGGGGGLVVFNADPVRETDRAKAIRLAGRCPDNEAWVRWLAKGCDVLIAGWGPDAAKFGGDRVMGRALSGLPLMALIVNADGSPRHPLYIGYDVQPKPYTPALAFATALTAAAKGSDNAD